MLQAYCNSLNCLQVQQCTGFKSMTIICSTIKVCFTCCRVSFADINGTRYSKADLLICSMCDDDPLFGKLVDLVITQSNKCWLVLQPFKATRFNQHFNSYEVEPQGNYIICQQQDLVDHHTLSICKSFDSTLQSTNFVTLKYFVM